MEHGTIGQTCASRDFSFWECVSCNFSACPSLLAARFSTSANNLSLSCCISRSIEKGNISLTSSKWQRAITFSLLFYYLHRSFLLFKFQKFLSKMLLQCHGVQASIKFHFRLNYCYTDIYVKSPHASTIGKRATIPSKRTAQPRALSHFKFYIRN